MPFAPLPEIQKMSTSEPIEFTLGCDPQVKVFAVEDHGNLFLRLSAVDPETTDIDAVFFNLNDDSHAAGLTVFPFVNDDIVKGIEVDPGKVDTTLGGGHVNEPYDVRVDFGQVDNSNEGDVNEANMTFFSMEGMTLEDVDWSNVTVVVNSDDGKGIALTNGETPDSGETYETYTAMEDDFSHEWWLGNNENIKSYDGWHGNGHSLVTSGGSDGTLELEEVESDGPVSFSFDIKANDPSRFESDGWGKDSLKVEVQVDGGDWVTLDEFTVDEKSGQFTGSETGQTFDGHSSTLNYSGGILDDVEEGASFRIVSDISACNEKLYLDNFKVTASDVVEDEEEVCEDFDDAETGNTAYDQFEGFTVTGKANDDDDDDKGDFWGNDCWGGKSWGHSWGGKSWGHHGGWGAKSYANWNEADEDEDDDGNDAMVFDTAHPTGGDWDLYSKTQGKAIILSEDGDSDDPDDNADGGTLTFEFDSVSSVQSLSLLDNDEHGSSIDLYDAEGGLLKTISVPKGWNGGKQTIEIDTDGVATMDVNLAGSGAVDDLCFTPEKDEEEDDCDDKQYELDYEDVMKDAPEEEEDEASKDDDEDDDEDDCHNFWSWVA